MIHTSILAHMLSWPKSWILIWAHLPLCSTTAPQFSFQNSHNFLIPSKLWWHSIISILLTRMIVLACICACVRVCLPWMLTCHLFNTLDIENSLPSSLSQTHYSSSHFNLAWQSIEQIGNRADRMRIGTHELYLYSSTDVEVHAFLFIWFCSIVLKPCYFLIFVCEWTWLTCFHHLKCDRKLVLMMFTCCT